VTAPEGKPGPHDFTTELCPHCDQPQWPSRTDEHVATAHADIPPCTAAIDTAHRGLLACICRAGHRRGRGEYGELHVSASGPLGRHVWNDTAPGVTPHKETP
jgi:hypothetical protein